MQDDDSLKLNLVSQDSLETGISQQAQAAIYARDIELDQKRLEKATRSLQASVANISRLQARLDDPHTRLSLRKQLRDDIAWFQENELTLRQRDVDEITQRIDEARAAMNRDTASGGQSQLSSESEHEFLVRTGKITAFGNQQGFAVDNPHYPTRGQASHTKLLAPGLGNHEKGTGLDNSKHASHKVVETDQGASDDSAMSDYEPDLADVSSDDGITNEPEEETENTMRNIDDGDERVYQHRLQQWIRKRSSLRKAHSGIESSDDTPEWRLPHPELGDAVLNDNFRLPGDIYPSLFDYQKTGVQWLYELYTQKAGGIIGDEMGLGKTIQVISFLAGLHYLGLLHKPVLVVVPATVLNQWVNEFHRWWPAFRCVILHSIGLGMGKNRREDEIEAILESASPGDSKARASLADWSSLSASNAREMIDRVMEKGHVLVTTYVGVRVYSQYILPHEWGYVVLDEGHKIRNPDLEISLTCKQVKTCNRIILLGTPIQNNLTELWLLFDFVFPGRLGTLPVFQQEFAIPINMGGYANALNVQVQTGYQCAVVLRDLISPYLLRRLKSDVAQDLPKKTEMVLFVKLTMYQQQLYEEFLKSQDIKAIMNGRRNVLMGVDILRKICNHPDLVQRDTLMRRPNYGDPAKLGKLQVLGPLLQMWQQQGHKTLLFCQTRQMLDILERFVGNLGTMLYLRMDGQTAIAKRQALVDQFNGDADLVVFLLTTKVGGLGVNLTGANRIIIFDPDWNPSTDMQARERAWRLGQKRDITIYRLMTTGLIEEKIYHRQIFKTFLTNKILKDPKQRRFFKHNDLHDLFTLGDQNEEGTETGAMFGNGYAGSVETRYGGGGTAESSTHTSAGNTDDFYQVAGIEGVSKLDAFEGADNKADPHNDDARLMEGIFAKNGVHSTLRHDQIVDTRVHEQLIVEREASRIARAAAETLKQSRRLARKNAVGTPTWTGKFGARIGGARRPTCLNLNRKGAAAGPSSGAAAISSSQSILAGLRQKKSTNEATPAVLRNDTMTRLVTFLQGQAERGSTSNEILRSCGISLKSVSETALVRSMLREICNWNALDKKWQLKSEFMLERGVQGQIT